MSEITYGRTAIGQLLYDLAFTNATTRWLARKHKMPVAKIREMRAKKSIKSLRRQNKLPAVCV